MSISPLELMFQYTVDILDFDEDKVEYGRTNYEDIDFSEELIVIDSLTPGDINGTLFSYDDELEEESITKMVTSEFALNFYGTDALSNAQSWLTVNDSQKARNAEQSLDISVFNASGITDLKMLAGSDYTERYELTVKMNYNINNKIELLRIDSVEINSLTDNPSGSTTITINTEE